MHIRTLINLGRLILYDLYRKQLYGSVNELCPNFRDLRNGDQLKYLLNSDGPIEKDVARFFYLANLMPYSVIINKDVYILCLLCLFSLINVCMECLKLLMSQI